MRTAEQEATGAALMTIGAPTAVDADGNSVPTRLTVTGDTITITVKPESTTTYPILVSMEVAAPTNTESTERDPFEYGLADNKPEAFAPFDENLETGSMQVRTARITIPYDVATKPIEEREKKEKNDDEKAVLLDWLRNVSADKLPAPSKGHLEPYITLTADKFVKSDCENHRPGCQPPSVSQFRAAFKKLFDDLVNGSSKEKLPPVRLWGAWNEPDGVAESLVKNPKLAAKFWQAAQSVVSEYKSSCGGCTVVAGEFEHYDPSRGAHDYVEHYRNQILSYCSQCWNDHRGDWLHHGMPGVWGFHDYEDVVNLNRVEAEGFAAFTAHKVAKPKLWISEAGVELENRQTPTKLTEGCEVNEKCSSEQIEHERLLQREAAKDLLKLHEASSRYQRLYYYTYKGTLPGKEKEFDSGLLNSKGERREAYCVLAYSDEECPPAVT
jgi:hypothetical protein